MSKILIVGGTGNISAECAALLYERGHQISVVTRGQSVIPPGYRAVQADRKDATAMKSALAGPRPDVVINFIGYEMTDIQTDYDVFKNVGQYIFISSTTVYAKPAKVPTTEAAPKGNTWWDYAQKKLACEQWLLERHGRDGFPVTIARPSHTYSKRWVPNPVSSASYTFAARLEQGKPVFVPDDGENPWTLTAASDFAVGLAGLVGKREAIGEDFHITSDEVLTWNQICREIVTALGASAPQIVPVPVDVICQTAPQLIGTLKGDKVHPGIFDNAKLKRFVPEFRCQTPFHAGVRKSVGWLRAHPESQNLNPKIDEMCEQVVGAWRKAC